MQESANTATTDGPVLLTLMPCTDWIFELRTMIVLMPDNLE